MSEELIETSELQEKLDAAIERVERDSSPKWILYLSFSTAVLAVIAAVASLESGSLSNEALLYKNEAVLIQSKASDNWSYYQAKGIKEKIYSVQADLVATTHHDLAQKYAAQADRYKQEQSDLEKTGRDLEKKVDENNERAARCMEYHHLFAIAVTLFQVGIALSAIATLTRKKALWWLGLATSAIGFLYFIRGLMFFAH